MWTGIVTSGLGAVCALIGGRSMYRGIASKSWPSVSGRIVESQVVETRRTNGTSAYAARITYEYAKEHGETARSAQISCGFQGGSIPRVVAARRVSRYPVGSEVNVFIDPDKPTNTIIKPGIAGSSYFAFSLGIAFLAIGSFVVARAL